jgi:hypothetical protein
MTKKTGVSATTSQALTKKTRRPKISNKAKKIKAEEIKATAKTKSKKVRKTNFDKSETVEQSERVYVPLLPKKKTAKYYFDAAETNSPDWRNRQIESILNLTPDKYSLANYLPKDVAKAFYFREACNRIRVDCEDHRQAEMICCNLNPELYSAYRIYEQPSDMRRVMLEARILSGQSVSEIARLSAMDDEVVETYMSLFFDVQSRLEAKDWICSEVLGRVFQSGDTHWHYAMTAKYFAYFGGPQILESVMYGANPLQSRCSGGDSISGWIDGATRFRIRVQSLVAATTYQPNRFDVTDLLGGYMSLVALENREKALDGEDNVLTKILEAVKIQNPVLLGDKANPVKYGQDVIHPSVVPRPVERMLLAHGEVPETLSRYTDSEYSSELTLRYARKASGTKQLPPAEEVNPAPEQPQ